MSNYFEENRRFLGLNGVLGRRDFIVNCVIIEIIEALICSTPVVYLFLVYPELLKSFSSVGTVPTWYSQWVLVVGLISSVLYFSSILRRVRDIVGTEDDNRINIIAGVLTVLNFLGYLPFGSLGKFFSIFVLIFLAIQSGTITSSNPKNEVVKFNWGAFFGTWMWGLFNKSYVTLFMIPLFFTFGGFPFMILCGLKGNEWAYKNKKAEELDKFHEEQKNQAVIWLILTPILSFVISVILAVVAGVATFSYAKTHPEFTKKVTKMFSTYQVSAVESSFDKIEVENGVYKFYTDPEDWEDMSEFLMVAEFKNAMTYALIKEDKTFVTKTDFLEFIDVINNVKIYSTFNNEVLAQYYMNPDEAKELRKLYLEKKITGDELRAKFKEGYKFNTQPSLP